MPARSQFLGARMNLSLAISPLDLHFQGFRRVNRTQTKMDLWAAAPGMSGAAIDLPHQFAAIGEVHFCDRANGWRAIGMHQSQAKKSARFGRLILEEVRRPPLVGGHEIQPPIPIHISNGNPSRDQRLIEAKERSNVVIAPINTAHEKRIAVVSTQIRTGTEAGPEARIMNNLIVARAQGLQFGPAIDCSFDKSAGLHGFQHAIVVKIRQTRFPGKTAARQAELLAAVDIWSNSFLHPACFPGAEPQEMTFREAAFRGDVAHVDIEQSVPIHVAEIDAHALERVLSQNAGFWRHEIAPAFEQRKLHVTRRGSVVQQAVGTEVVGDVDFREKVPIEVRRANSQGPTTGHVLPEKLFDFAEGCCAKYAIRRWLPEEHVFISAIECLGLALMH